MASEEPAKGPAPLRLPALGKSWMRPGRATTACVDGTAVSGDGAATGAAPADGGEALFKPRLYRRPAPAPAAYTGVSKEAPERVLPGAHAHFEVQVRNDSVNDAEFADASIGDPVRVALQQRLAGLRLEHRDLDIAIEQFERATDSDELAVRRMKRRKLLLKDQIARLEREIDPDVLA